MLMYLTLIRQEHLPYLSSFANNLNPNTAKGGGTAEERKENVKELLNFFPVIGEDEQGDW